MTVKTFDSVDEVLEFLAEELQRYSQSSKAVHIALSGGSTPKRLFQYIVDSDYARSINWDALHFWWGDERCVPSDDSESNYGEAKRLLFDHVEIPAENLHPIRGEAEPLAESMRLRQELKRSLMARLGRPQFDWILLGLGEDGHTASLFPNQTDYATDEGVVIARHPDSGQQRLSLAAPLIRMAKRISYLVLGEGKAGVVKEIVHQEGAYLNYPASHISSTEGQTEWILDQSAACQLDNKFIV